VITDGRLSHLTGVAYGVSMAMIKEAPDSVTAGSERFNIIEARAEDPAKATETQLCEMLQGLLAERFHLKFHGENREMPGFAMVVGKYGHKPREAKGDEVVASFGDSGSPGWTDRFR